MLSVQRLCFARMLVSFRCQQKIVIPSGIDPAEVEVWFFTLYDSVTQFDLDRFCDPLGHTLCHLVTSGALKKLVFVSANYSMVQVLVITFYTLVDFVMPDFEISLAPDNEDDVVEQQPGLLQLGAATWGLNRIEADARDRTGSSATIFILDTGVRTTHTDFGGRAASGADVTSGFLVECNGNLGCAADNQGHGTHCAGTAGGTTYGVAPAAKIRSVKMLGDSGSGSWSWSYEALDWLATSPVRPAVASVSLGGNGVVVGMKDAVDAAVSSGVVVVVAAGNANSDACGFSPAYAPSAITVGSTDSNDARS